MYTGQIINDGEIKDVDRIVTRDGIKIDPAVSLKVVNHSPDGFSWGYPGSGPAQLALGILLVHLNGDKERALSLYHDFKFKVIAKLPMDENFSLTDAQVETAISEIDITRMQRS
jgi:hypothetical protein